MDLQVDFLRAQTPFLQILNFMARLGSGLPLEPGSVDKLAGPTTPYQPSLSCLLPTGRGGAGCRTAEDSRTRQFVIWPLGLCFFPSHISCSIPIPLHLPSSSSSNPKDRWGPAGRNVTTLKALSSGKSPGVTAVSLEAYPVPHVWPCVSQA